jgi:hypothetical protein
MELISLYLTLRISIETKGISNQTFHQLKRTEWYTDTRSNRKYTMLNKRIEIDNKWYRAMIRFEYDNMIHGQESFNLTLPTPFIVTECEPVESTTTARWRDTKAYHGGKLGIDGLLEKGVPLAVIENVYEDLKNHTQYINKERYL